MEFKEILFYIPFLLLAIYFGILLRNFLQTFIKLKERELNLLSAKNMQKNQLAYERMTLFLERIKPANLIKRFGEGLKSHEFLFLVEKHISEEFDYNAAQQLYISKNTWQNIVSAKNNMIQLTHSTYSSISKDVDLEDFKTLLLMNYMNGEDFIANTQNDLKREMLVVGGNLKD